MRDHLSALPDEILCYILSFVTLRDSVRTRSLSSRWRYLSDYRSVLHFDTLNVLGTKLHYFNSDNQSKYVSAVDQLLEMWKGCDFSALKVQFHLTYNQASHIDRWVESGIRMEIKDLEPYFGSRTLYSKPYVLSDQQLHSDKAFNLRCLRLKYCALTLSPGCASWISLLTNLELCYVPLHEEEMQYVFNGGSNLTSLSLVDCCKVKPPSNIISCLKRLKIKIDVPVGFDPLTVIQLLNASPFLETLHLQLCDRRFDLINRVEEQYIEKAHICG